MFDPCEDDNKVIQDDMSIDFVQNNEYYDVDIEVPA